MFRAPVFFFVAGEGQVRVTGSMGPGVTQSPVGSDGRPRIMSRSRPVHGSATAEFSGRVGVGFEKVPYFRQSNRCGISENGRSEMLSEMKSAGNQNTEALLHAVKVEEKIWTMSA